MNPSRRQMTLAMGLGALWASGASHAGLSAQPSGGLLWQERHLLGFGTSLSLKAAHRHAKVLASALDEAVALIQHLDQILSLFRPDSAVSQLNAQGHLAQPPAELVAVLRVAQSVSQRSGGAFDVTVQPLWRVFADAAPQALPTPQALNTARALVGWQHLHVADNMLRLGQPGMGITLNGIAQGHAADRVRAVLQSHGVTHALIDTGEWAMLGHNARQRPWLLGLADPRSESHVLARLASDGRCVATSADNHTHFSDDLVNHHIFNPHTGRSPLELASVTVVARSGALADALTKVFFVMGPHQASALAKQWGVDALWVDKQGRMAATPGMRLVSASSA